MASSSLRDVLVGKTAWTKQQLSARVQSLRARAPMTTATAQAVLAHQQGIQIDRHLDKDELHTVRDVVSKLATTTPGSGAKATSKTPKKTEHRPASPERRIVFPSKFDLTDPFLSPAKIQEAREMAAVYPILYVLENSMRGVVQRVMRARYGEDWWDKALTNGSLKTLKQNSDIRRAKEEQTSWHQRRGAHPIDYIDLAQLGALILAKQDDFFPHVLGDNRQWLEQFMRELEPSRNVLCHMNPLSELNAKDIELKAQRWQQLLERRRDKIPEG